MFFPYGAKSETTLTKQWVEELVSYLSDSNDIDYPDIVSYTINKSKCSALPFSKYQASCLDCYVGREVESDNFKFVERTSNFVCSSLVVMFVSNLFRTLVYDDDKFVYDFHYVLLLTFFFRFL